MPPKPKTSRTIAVSAQIGNDPSYGAVTPPIYLSSTYKFAGLDDMGKYDYGRSGNPNRDGLADAVAQLEGGAGAVVTSSGMAAIDLVLNLITADQWILAPHDCYGGTHRLLTHRELQGRLKVRFIDQTDSAALARALADEPAMVLIETPSNPLMRIVDIRKTAAAAHKAGAIVVADNTFLSPARQTPLSLGADIVVHSATKYINGHSDVVGGLAIAKTQETTEQLIWWANCVGSTGAPFDSYLILRGLRTLHARMDVQEANAMKIAAFLDAHDGAGKVYYPGLKSDPGYQLAQAQQSGPGAMLSFELNGGRENVARFLAKTDIFQLAESLGGTESLICHPASMTHRAMDEAARAKAGISESLIRISVGLESIDDQIAELRALFANVN